MGTLREYAWHDLASHIYLYKWWDQQSASGTATWPEPAPDAGAYGQGKQNCRSTGSLPPESQSQLIFLLRTAYPQERASASMSVQVK